MEYVISAQKSQLLTKAEQHKKSVLLSTGFGLPISEQLGEPSTSFYNLKILNFKMSLTLFCC